MDHLYPALLGNPILQWLLVCAGTFVLEDAATVEAALLVSADHMNAAVALSALYVGVVLGDIGLYGLGYAGARFAWARRWMPDTRRARLADRAGDRVIPIVVVTRFIPGARLPTYVMCGVLALGLWPFALASALATAAWTTGLFALSVMLGPAIRQYLGPFQWFAPLGLVLTVFVVGRLVTRERP